MLEAFFKIKEHEQSLEKFVRMSLQPDIDRCDKAKETAHFCVSSSNGYNLEKPYIIIVSGALLTETREGTKTRYCVRVLTNTHDVGRFGTTSINNYEVIKRLSIFNICNLSDELKQMLGVADVVAKLIEQAEMVRQKWG